MYRKDYRIIVSGIVEWPYPSSLYRFSRYTVTAVWTFVTIKLQMLAIYYR